MKPILALQAFGIFVPSVLGLFGGSLVFAQPPAPIDATRYAFPGAVASPGSPISAGLALADRWLGGEPFWNPAVPRGRFLAASALALHVSRQDLRAENREFSDEAGYFDLAGAWAGIPLGSFELLAYVHDPELRLEDNAYTVGRIFQPGISATVTNHVSSRELRAGAGVSTGLGPARLGAALEWTHRADTFLYHEESGSPSSGDQKVSWSGDGFGGSVGARASLPLGPRTVEIGASARIRPRIALDGTQSFDLLSGSSENVVHATRQSAWEGGVSARVATAENFKITAGAGGSGTERWDGFDVTRGGGTAWSVAGEFHDPRDPWTLRFGGGIESMRGVPEPRTGIYALGFGWRFQSFDLDFGLTHRSVSRGDEPTSYDERLVIGVSMR